MHFRRWFFALFACCFAFSAETHAQMPPPEGAMTVTLIADTTAIEAGKTFTAGVRMVMGKDWYTYWRFEGNIGQPINVTWELPPGFKAGETQWPLPLSHEAPGDFYNYVYEHEVILMAEITPPATLPAGPIVIKAKASWQVCNPMQCVPGNSELKLTLPAGPAKPDNAALFKTYQAQLPQTTTAPFKISWDRSKAESLTVEITGLAEKDIVEFLPIPPPDVVTEKPTASAATPDGKRTITFPVSKGGAANLRWEGVVSVQKPGQPREGWTVADPVAPPPQSPPAAAPASPSQGAGESLLWKLGVAFLGGLIMNIMPCVLPVIALKIFGFVNQAGETPERVFRFGLAFVAGVFTFFIGIALVVMRLKTSFQWGYHFQNGYLLVGMIALVFLFGLNMLGVFEISMGSRTTSQLSELSSKEGYGGAFLHGIFTTLLGTSCTAPFLGSSLGFAVTQSPFVILLIFLAIAAGMSLPYFLLTARPAWLRYVPKPGPWMERSKQFLGFLMLGIAAWLLGVLASRGSSAVTGTSLFLVVLGLTAWLFGQFRSGFARLAMFLLPVAGFWFLVHGNLTAKTTSQFIEKKINDARAANLPVFVDFTADWCVNCKVFEKTVLHSDVVQAKFREKKVVFIVADWTNTEDPEVTRLLRSFNSVGVPLYLLYRPGEDKPFVTESLTRGSLISELDRIKN